MDFNAKYNTWVSIVNEKLDSIIKEYDCPQKQILSAMRYSLLCGGKRLRPVLSLAVCELLEGRVEDVLPFACSIEMIHTYSLIHDDLPAMDNDDYRRGRLTNHKVYGEAMAILAGDALLNSAFEYMLEYLESYRGDIRNGLKAAAIIAKAAGIQGMIGGQVVDMMSENKDISLEMLEYMHRCKTGQIIKASIMAPAAICNADSSETDALSVYADNIGLAFQIRDDILDVDGDPALLGKNTGSDQINKKTTFVTVYGLEKSLEILKSTTEKAVSSIRYFGEKGKFLEELAYNLQDRVK